MRIVLLGAGGQLADDLRQRLSHHELIGWTRAELDITDPAAVDARLTAVAPHVVVNTAAYNLVDQAESDCAPCFAVNAIAPLHLARACAKLDAKLVHFSTDYVFGLEPRNVPWLETDAPGPVSVYGTAKLAGEYAVRGTGSRHLVLRTCGLYGLKGSRGKGGNFVETMLRLAGEKKPLRVVADQWCTPSWTGDVARVAGDLIESDREGLFHVTNAGQSTWHAFAEEIFRQSGLAVECSPITSAEFAAAARRPGYSVLSNAKTRDAGIAVARPWQEALAEYLQLRAARQRA